MDDILSSEHCRALISQFPDAIILVDTAGVINYVNSRAESLFAYPESGMLGKSLDIIIPERFREQHWKGFDRAVKERQTKYKGKALPTKALKADGSFIYVELAFAIILDEQGEVNSVLASARDIHERMMKEKRSS